MKKTLLKIATVLVFGFQLSTAMAQAPQKMSYQAVVRNSSNALVTSLPVGMQISILQGSASGTAVYVETQTATTNANGLVTIEIGNGTPVTGTFSSINWAAGPYYIMTETDPTGGTAYSISGTTQLMSVPYALYAETSGSGAVGATGADGINGTNGVDGTNGTNGVDGVNGTNGVDGINGTNGVDGINGTNGVDGTNGTNGVDGMNGTNGVDGVAGSTGATGATGSMGMPGMPGTNGTNGTNGSTGTTGAIGATGLAGANGTNGTNGSTGATGAIGVTGAAGANGANGTNGSTGTTGAIGATGLSGINGTNGSNGATGSTGATGLAGTNGANGANGIDGATGATGLIADGAAAGNTPYWDGTAWVVNSSNIYNNGGNVGIGTTTPNAPLQFSNATVTRKIVLWEGGNNDHQFYGLGINSAMLRYQIDGPAACHAFYAGSSATTSNELMRIQGNGNVGIGNASPAFRLDVTSPSNFIANFATSNTIDRSSLVKITNNNASPNGWFLAVGGTGNGLGITNGEMYVESSGAKDLILRNQASNTTETFRIRGSNGGVGIGTATPNAALQFGNVLANRRIVLWEDANNDHQFYGFGMNGNTLRYQVAAPSQNHVFYAGASTTASNELMRIQGNGNVGIGTTTPSAKLEVTGTTKINGQLEVATTTGAILIPRLTATERTALTAVPGMMIYNSSTGKFQGYASGLGAEALDQSMTIANSTMNSSMVGQSFIAGATGELSKIDVTVSVFTAAGSCTIRVYDGAGTGGALLGSLGGTISAAGIKSFTLTGINVVAGNTYTLSIGHSANCTWSMDSANSYPSGSFYTAIPTAAFDLWFKTYIKPVVNSWVDFH
jgi:hypothetical protein